MTSRDNHLYLSSEWQAHSCGTSALAGRGFQICLWSFEHTHPSPVCAVDEVHSNTFGGGHLPAKYFPIAVPVSGQALFDLIVQYLSERPWLSALALIPSNTCGASGVRLQEKRLISPSSRVSSFHRQAPSRPPSSSPAQPSPPPVTAFPRRHHHGLKFNRCHQHLLNGIFVDPKHPLHSPHPNDRNMSWCFWAPATTSTRPFPLNSCCVAFCGPPSTLATRPASIIAT